MGEKSTAVYKQKILAEDRTANIRAHVADLSRRKKGMAAKQKILTEEESANIRVQIADLSNTRILTQEQVAELLGVTKDTLEAWRYKRRYGLAYVKIGSLVRYFAKDVEAFLESRRVSVNPEPAGRQRRRLRSEK